MRLAVIAASMPQRSVSHRRSHEHSNGRRQGTSYSTQSPPFATLGARFARSSLRRKSRMHSQGLRMIWDATGPSTAHAKGPMRPGSFSTMVPCPLLTATWRAVRMSQFKQLTLTLLPAGSEARNGSYTLKPGLINKRNRLMMVGRRKGCG